jgi:hypothetical protein
VRAREGGRLDGETGRVLIGHRWSIPRRYQSVKGAI